MNYFFNVKMFVVYLKMGLKKNYKIVDYKIHL